MCNKDKKTKSENIYSGLDNTRENVHSAVRRDHAENYILTSLVAFAVTVIITRLFLELTGYPQLGNSVLHIAHALWGGFLLMIAVMLPLAYANRWAIQLSALLGGVGIGLFIDEVGKFITQANDYFFPPALPLIYGIILIFVLVYVYLRQPHQVDPRIALHHAMDGMQDAIDGNLDAEKAGRIEAQLTVARGSERKEIVSLANAISAYLTQEKQNLSAARPDFWKRVSTGVDAFGQRVGRRLHRNIISGLLVLWLAFVVGYILILVQGVVTLDRQVLQWSGALIGIQSLIGGLMILAIFAWLTRNEERGLNFGVAGFLLSLVALQTLYFYISQFSAITATLLQLAFLQILITYRRWYLDNDRPSTNASEKIS